MKPRILIWTGILAFLGYSIGAEGAIENVVGEFIGAISGAIVGFLIGWSLQRYQNPQKSRTFSER
jgi:uncharacterized membrane protein